MTTLNLKIFQRNWDNARCHCSYSPLPPTTAYEILHIEEFLLLISSSLDFLVTAVISAWMLEIIALLQQSPKINLPQKAKMGGVKVNHAWRLNR